MAPTWRFLVRGTQTTPPYTAASFVHVNQSQLVLVTKRRYMWLSPGKLTHEVELAGRQPVRGTLYCGYRLALPAVQEEVHLTPQP